jgi:hypothetical protein
VFCLRQYIAVAVDSVLDCVVCTAVPGRRRGVQLYQRQVEVGRRDAGHTGWSLGRGDIHQGARQWGKCTVVITFDNWSIEQYRRERIQVFVC